MTLGHDGESVADRYRLDRLAGGTRDLELWEAYDTRLARSVSVRLERDPVDADGDADGYGDGEQGEDPRSVLTRIARLNHPNVAAVYDVGVAGGDGAERVRYAVSEWSDGHTLGQLMQGGPLPWTRVADWGRQTSAGLAALHEIGIVHGALDPDRVAVFDDRRIKIVDAGLEQSLGGDGPQDEGAAGDMHALGEMLWRAVAGAPPSARERAGGEEGDKGSAAGGGRIAAAAGHASGPGSGAAAAAGEEGAAHERTVVGRAAAVLDTEPLREAGMPPVLIELLTEMLAHDPAVRPTAAEAEERFAPLVPVERAADTVPEYPTSPTLGMAAVAGAAGGATGATARTRAIRPAAKPSAVVEEKKNRKGLMVGLAALIAAAGAGLGLIIANLASSSGPQLPAVNVSVSGSAGVINLPNPTVPSSSAAARTTAAQTTAAASSAPPSSASASASATPSASGSAGPSTNPSGSASASTQSSQQGGAGASSSATTAGQPGGPATG